MYLPYQIIHLCTLLNSGRLFLFAMLLDVFELLKGNTLSFFLILI